MIWAEVFVPEHKIVEEVGVGWVGGDLDGKVVLSARYREQQARGKVGISRDVQADVREGHVTRGLQRAVYGITCKSCLAAIDRGGWKADVNGNPRVRPCEEVVNMKSSCGCLQARAKQVLTIENIRPGPRWGCDIGEGLVVGLVNHVTIET